MDTLQEFADSPLSGFAFGKNIGSLLRSHVDPKLRKIGIKFGAQKNVKQGFYETSIGLKFWGQSVFKMDYLRRLTYTDKLVKYLKLLSKECT
jgi:hypothetical protein